MIAQEKIAVRYIVKDVEESISFYENYLGFEVEMHPASGFAILSKGDLRLLINEPGIGGAGQNMPDGTTPAPGSWNRVQLTVDDLGAEHRRLRNEGLTFRNEIVEGGGGKQILLQDPSGNLIELFEPARTMTKFKARGYHILTPFIATEDPEGLISFLRSAFGGEVTYLMRSEDEVLRHATVKIGDSKVMISPGTDLYKPMPVMLQVYVEDTDATYKKALELGAEAIEEPHNELYGDRRAGVQDKWGNKWWIATHIEDVSEEQMKKREKEFH